MDTYTITKEIEIDAAHRVPDHGSKCRNLHGHRYKIMCYVQGEELETSGVQNGMLMDFSFLKELMMEFIDANCDHGAIFYLRDPILLKYTGEFENIRYDKNKPSLEYETILETMNHFGAWRGQHPLFGKTYIVPFIPTAENLARHWYELLKDRVAMRCNNKAKLVRVQVWETPSSTCFYPST